MGILDVDNIQYRQSNMTPKEKAKELVDKFLPLVRNSDLYDTYLSKAKQCAIICVEEIIKEVGCDLEDKSDTGAICWQEVKQEIKQLN